VVARKDGDELSFAPSADGWKTSGSTGILGQPDALERAWAALANRNAGDLVVSAAPGSSSRISADATTRAAGATARSDAGDSEVPMLSIGAWRASRADVDVTPRVLEHFGVSHER
jgi:hypothetical protein